MTCETCWTLPMLLGISWVGRWCVGGDSHQRVPFSLPHSLELYHINVLIRHALPLGLELKCFFALEKPMVFVMPTSGIERLQRDPGWDCWSLTCLMCGFLTSFDQMLQALGVGIFLEHFDNTERNVRRRSPPHSRRKVAAWRLSSQGNRS